MMPFAAFSPDGPQSRSTDEAGFGTWRWSPASDAFVLDEPLRHRLGFGRGPSSLADWLERVPQDEAESLRAAWRDVADRGVTSEQLFTLVAPDGPRRLLARARLQDDASGRAVVGGVLLDVTAEALAASHADARAREQDERLRLTHEAGHIGAFEWLVADERVEWSPELERLYDVAPGTFGNGIGRWAEHVHPDDAVTVLAHVQASLARRAETSEFEFRARLPSGGYRWLAGRARFSYAPDGTPLKMIGVNTDIDARKQSESALRESESRFRHLADALPIMVWAARPDGEMDYVNEPWRRYTGLSSAAQWQDAMHPDDVEAVREGWATALCRRQRFEARCRLRRASDATYRWHSARGVPIDDPQGVLIRWLGAFIDDHELCRLVEANQQLLASEQRARQAAEDAGRMKDEFLATLGHELRTPLNAITGWTSLLRRGGLSSDDTAKAVDVIERNAEAQRHLIDEMLDISRIIAGHVRLDLQPVFIEDLLGQAVEAVRPVAEAKGLVLSTAFEPVPVPLTADPSRLQQVFANLLGNAVTFTPAGGQVAVALTRRDDEISVRVRDTGLGIAPAILPYVFDRFRQAESPGARRLGRLGLGLSIVKQIVQLHRGRVEASSAGEGTGSEFTVTLALDTARDNRQAATTPDVRASEVGASPLRGLSVLIIEDDADSREMLSVLLENAGAVPVAAATVTEGLRLLGDLQIDLVLSDIGMPGRDGFDLIRALRASPNPRVRRAPALAVTAFARAEDRRRILAAGFDAHVSKPVESIELVRAVADVMRQKATATTGTDSPPSP